NPVGQGGLFMSQSIPGPNSLPVQIKLRELAMGAGLPFQDLLSAEVIARALAVAGVWWLECVYSPEVTLRTFLWQVLGAEHPAEVLSSRDLSRFETSRRVRVSASQPVRGGEVTLHFVNYNRLEPKEKRSAGRGAEDENPIAAEGVKV